MELPSPIAIAVLISCGLVAWSRPFAGLGFVVLGAIPYYSALHVLGVETSGALTGGLFGVVGLASSARLAARSGSRISWLPLLAFGLFVSLWYLRWLQDPPPLAPGASSADFAGRARVLMLVFAVVPFVGASLIRREADLDELLRWLAFWGTGALFIVLLYWLTDQPSLGPEWSEKWEPIPSLTGIILSLDIGMGLLAFLAATDGRRGAGWTAARLAAMVAASGVSVRVGQRGPFLFLLVSLVGYLVARSPALRLRTVIGGLAALIAIGSTVIATSDSFDATRAVQVESYSAETNQNRTDLVSSAFHFIGERPIEGWGGSLVGAPIEGGEWQYSHVFLLDPLVETGLFGAFLVWGVLGFVLLTLGRCRSVPLSGGTVSTVLIPMFAYVFLEAQVSGHVSLTKHLWLLVGLCIGMSDVCFTKLLALRPTGWGSPSFDTARATLSEGHTARHHPVS